MKQILFVGAGQDYSKGAFAFLRAMQQQERVHARALFFKPVDYASLSAVSANSGVGLGPVMELEEKENENMAAHKILFARQCEQNYIPYTIHDNNREWNKELLVIESRFADLILISGDLFYADAANSQPNHYLREVLHAAECPVLIIPETFTAIDRLFMAYDGSRESLYAIKQFCYLFPQYTDLPTEVVYIKKDSGHPIPDLEYLRQFSKLKFNCINFSNLPFKAAEYFATWLGEKENVLLVSGSFGRGPLSYLARRSFAEDIIHDHRLPVFIAHH